MKVTIENEFLYKESINEFPLKIMNQYYSMVDEALKATKLCPLMLAVHGERRSSAYPISDEFYCCGFLVLIATITSKGGKFRINIKRTTDINYILRKEFERERIFI